MKRKDDHKAIKEILAKHRAEWCNYNIYMYQDLLKKIDTYFKKGE